MLWRDWFPDVLPRVPGCPDILAEHELRETAQALMEQTGLWVREALPQPVLANQKAVVLDTGDPDAVTARINDAWLDGRRLNPLTPEAMCARTDDWTAQVGRPFACFMDEPGMARLFPIPSTDAVSGFTARLRVMPSDAAPGLPDALARTVKAAVVGGALARLFLYTGKPWTNADLAGVAGQAFAAQADKLTAQAARGQVGARIPSTIRWC